MTPGRRATEQTGFGCATIGGYGQIAMRCTGNRDMMISRARKFLFAAALISFAGAAPLAFAQDELDAPPETEVDETPSIIEKPAVKKEPTRVSNPVAEFAGLDKITGRIISFDVYINETVQFGALQVTPKVCYDRPDAEEPKTDTFVEVDEITLDRKIRRIFTGWMFAESPGLSLLALGA